ncbi:MAG TPA: hypothetical protein VK461_01740, partial [Acidimicrobiales bacterium]|nr:hypothetical protein [Acidimicrobiales bacterium]
MKMNAPVKLFAVAGVLVGIAIIGLAKCSAPPNPGNPPFTVTTVATMTSPIAMATRVDDGALYVGQWDGRVFALRSGALDPTPVLDIS